MVREKAATEIRRLYDLFVKVDATQVEINPLAETSDDRVFCIDAKLNFDDNAQFRQKKIFDSVDEEEDTVSLLDMLNNHTICLGPT